MFLCRTLKKTLAELQQAITADELCLWLADYQLQPWGEWRDDLCAGQITAMIANVNTKRGGFKPSDFMPDFERQFNDGPQTSEQMKQIGMSVTAALGGKFVGG